MTGHIAVLKGGVSAEREVSLVSGEACAAALREAGLEVREIDVGADIGALVAALEPAPEVVFNALHGRWGEDGCVQGLLELMGLAYTHSGVLASALAMDKVRAKEIAAAAGLRVPEGRIVSLAELRAGDPMERPYVVKPANEGSSVGVYIIAPGANAPDWGAVEWPYGDQILVEAYVPGRELTVSVMGERPLAVTEIAPNEGFYDYRAKYSEGVARHLVPAPIAAEVYEEALQAALAAHRALGCRGVSRSDFRYDDEAGEPGDLYYLETNTQPGMTPLSLVPEQARHVGISFPELCRWIVEQARCGG